MITSLEYQQSDVTLFGLCEELLLMFALDVQV